MKIYNCPGNNPKHWAYSLKNKIVCDKDYEHGFKGGSRTDTSFACSDSSTFIDPVMDVNLHDCDNKDGRYQCYGTAVDDCTADQYGRLWAGNGEYGSLVKYCPFCGEKGTE